MNTEWLEANQQYLSRSVAEIREVLERRIDPQPIMESKDSRSSLAWPESSSPPALEVLCAAFSLSAFEKSVLLLCAGVELDSRFSALCAAAQGDASRTYPTFSLALGALPEAHWNAIAPEAPLRRWHLIQLGSGSDTVTTSSLRISERVLHFLTGSQGGEEQLRGLIEPLGELGKLCPSQFSVVNTIVDAWKQARAARPVVQLCGASRATRAATAAAAAGELGLRTHRLRASDVPGTGRERDLLARLWEREAILSGSVLLVEAEDSDESSHAVMRLVENVHTLMIISASDPLPLENRTSIRLDLKKPSASEQRALWEMALGEAAQQLNGDLDRVLGHFDLDAHAINSVCAEARGCGPKFAEGIWSVCRRQSRPRLGALAHRIATTATWSDIVLPEPQISTLREIALHVRQRHRVYQQWGFMEKSASGLGISALFSGPSGTGKTMAAEVLANDLQLDLYRIDLSQIVSKYIGETEKNLRRVFEAAEGSGAILLFDEADALFGKRSEIRDSHDRYANIEVSYLLQRMEAYCGLAILTTNMKEALDQAFLRRIRFVAQFPFPGAMEREQIWRRIFPIAAPTEHLDPEKLARLNVSGGNIRNIALNAAFLAAGANEPVRMHHLLRATRSEYQKIEKPLTESELGGWR